jgi:hypothetical protein
MKKRVSIAALLTVSLLLAGCGGSAAAESASKPAAAAADSTGAGTEQTESAPAAEVAEGTTETSSCGEWRASTVSTRWSTRRRSASAAGPINW